MMGIPVHRSLGAQNHRPWTATTVRRWVSFACRICTQQSGLVYCSFGGGDFFVKFLSPHMTGAGHNTSQSLPRIQRTGLKKQGGQLTQGRRLRRRGRTLHADDAAGPSKHSGRSRHASVTRNVRKKNHRRGGRKRVCAPKRPATQSNSARSYKA